MGAGGTGISSPASVGPGPYGSGGHVEAQVPCADVHAHARDLQPIGDDVWIKPFVPEAADDVGVHDQVDAGDARLPFVLRGQEGIEERGVDDRPSGKFCG